MAAKRIIYQIIKAIGKRNNSESNFLLTDDVREVLDSMAEANAFVNLFINIHGFDSISYDLSSHGDLWNKPYPITIDELNLVI